jgi:hypothetical protein
MKIRCVVEHDTDSIVALWRDVFPEYDDPERPQRDPRASIARKLAFGDALFWLAEDDASFRRELEDLGVAANGEPCNDGTGLDDCCPASAQSGTFCDGTVVQCWTRCIFASADGGQGSRSQMACSGGAWSSGHGLFACQRGDGGK